MEFKTLHDWNVSLEEAKKIQNDLANRNVFREFTGHPKVIASADLAYSPERNLFFACVVVFIDHQIIEKKCETGISEFPYVPGFLSFREIPPLLKCFEKVESTPELLVVDGHGIAHPRRFGIASHLGMWLNIPTIGVAKKKIVGKYQEPVDETGFYSYLTYKEEVIGAVMKCRQGTKPVFISPGYLIDLSSSIRIVKELIDGYRIPYPTRIADKLVAQYKKEKLG